MNAATATNLHGKTANELRTIYANGLVSKREMIAYLSSKAKLRKPSADFLAELTGITSNERKRDEHAAGVVAHPEHAAGPVDRLADTWQASTIHSKTGKLLKGGALKKAWEKRMSEATAAHPEPTIAKHKATGGATPDPKPAQPAPKAKRDRIDVIVQLGNTIIDLAHEYRDLRDENGI